MAQQTVVVKGVKDTIKGLDRFHAKVENALKAVLKEALVCIHQAVKSAAPVRTGKYRKSINWRASRSGLVGWVYASRKAPGVIRGSQYDTHNSGDWEYENKRSKPRKRTRHGYIGHLLEYGTVRAKARPHWTPAREYMVVRFGPRLELAIKTVRMYRTKAD